MCVWFGLAPGSMNCAGGGVFWGDDCGLDCGCREPGLWFLEIGFLWWMRFCGFEFFL